MYINFPMMLLGATLIIAVFALVRVLKYKAPFGRVLVEVVFAYYLAALFAITLFPDLMGVAGDPFADAYWINPVPFATITNVIETTPSQIRTQIGGNLALLFPLGLLAPALFPKLRSFKIMLGLAFAIPVGIELSQFFEVVLRIANRSVDIDDVLLNATGFIMGYLVFFLCSQLYFAIRKNASGSLGDRKDHQRNEGKAS